MARILIAAWPPSGHLYPCLTVARELARRGHQVAVYSGARARPAVEREGFRLFPFERLDEARLDATIFAPDRKTTWRRPRAFVGHLRRWCVDTLPGQIADLEQLLASWRPDLILSDESLWAPALILREKHGTPVVVCGVTIGCLVPGRDAPLAGLGLPPPRRAFGRALGRGGAAVVEALATGLRRDVDDARRAHGLRPLATSIRAAVGAGPLYLLRGCPELDYRRADLPAGAAYAGPLDATFGPPTDAAWIDGLPRNRPLVYASEGSMPAGPPVVLRAALGAARGLGVHLVMATGPDRAPADLGLGALPDHVTARPWVPQRALVARADAVVTVGGTGTVLGALAAGVPLLVVPAEADQFDNARRVTDAGAGLAIARRRATPARVGRALRALLDAPSYRWRARQVARALARYRDAGHAADLVERQGLPRSRRSGT